MIVVLGGGLAGLSTALHLRRYAPRAAVVVVERESEPGGLARSRRVGPFTFDYTGHYLHLRDQETIALVETLLGDRLTAVERRAKIFARGALLDFPFQANLHGLPAEVVARCLLDFVAASRAAAPKGGAGPFGAWARETFGEGIAEEFLLPYNAKLYGVAPDEMTAEWVGWSVPRPSLEEVVRGALGLKVKGLGYNPSFFYPREGGIGALPAAFAARVADALRCGAAVEEVDVAARVVRLAGGAELPYEKLVSTLPLPALLRSLVGSPEAAALARLAPGLRAAGVVELALGVDRAALAGGLHWIYFPDPATPFYRVGFPSNVASSLAPPGHGTISVEFPLAPGGATPERDTLLAAARAGLEAAGILDGRESIVAADVAPINPAYVIHDPRRTPLVEEALRRLAALGIRSIGRFGGWTYSYMERAIIEGRAAAAALAEGR